MRGSAAPKGLIQAFESRHNIPFAHAYGMTETSPLVVFSRIKSYQQDLSDEEKLNIRAKQGYLVPGVEMKVKGANGDVKWDGNEMGELLLRGNWIADEYYGEESSAFEDGWLHTGDVVTVDEEGTIKIVDRTKDLIKSGESGFHLLILKTLSSLIMIYSRLAWSRFLIQSGRSGRSPVWC